MEEKLRKVFFSLNFQQGFISDEKKQEEANEMARERCGLFHGQTEVMTGDLKTLMFVVEDENTGEVHLVYPQLVKFKKEGYETK